MHRDMDLVRAILIAMADHEHGFAPPDFTVVGYAQETIGHHVWLMAQGGLITASGKAAFENGSPTAIPEAITWAGHDFLAAVQNETVWRKLKAELKDKGVTLPFSLISALALKILAKLAGL